MDFHHSRWLFLIHLWIGFALSWKTVSDLYHAYWGDLAFGLARVQAWLVVHLIINPLGWEATLHHHHIILAGQQVSVVLECLAPEILVLLVVLVVLLAPNGSQRWRGMLLCPFLFWVVNSGRMALLTILQVDHPLAFAWFHGFSCDLLLLGVAALSLWLWLRTTVTGTRTSASIITLGYGLALFLLSAAFFYLALWWLKASLGLPYQKMLFSFLQTVYAVKIAEVPPIPHLLHIAPVSLCLALIWLLPGLRWRWKLGATLGIIALRLGSDLYLCASFIQAYYQKTSLQYSLEIFGNQSRIFFLTASVSVTFLCLLVWRWQKKETTTAQSQGTEAEQNGRSLFPLFPETWVIALLPFFLSVTLEEALWLDLLCLVSWLGLPWLLCFWRFPGRCWIVVIMAFLFYGQHDWPVSSEIYEKRAYFHLLQEQYAQAQLALDRALASVQPDQSARLYSARALCGLILGNVAQATSDLALLHGGKEASQIRNVYYQVRYLQPEMATEILRARLLELFPEAVKERWRREERKMEQQRIARVKIAYEGKLRAFPQEAIYYGQRGILYFQEGNLFCALEDLQRALELDPSLSLCRYYRGLIYLQHRRYREAENDLSTWLRQNPLDTMASDYLQQCRSSQKKSSEESR